MPILQIAMKKLQNTMFRTCVFAIGVACACVLPVHAQVMTNNGGIITVAPRAVLHINGTYTSVANGTMTAADSARLRVSGSLHITSGRVALDGRSVAIVDSNLTIGGFPCTVAYGFLERRGTGTLTVKGMLINEGLVTCSGTIYVWRDFLNRGSLSNSGLIEVGQP